MKKQSNPLNHINLRSFLFSKDLHSKILFTIFCVLIYRLGTKISLPFINPELIEYLINIKKKDEGVNYNINRITGGDDNYSLMSMGLGTYITSSIIIRLFSYIYPPLINIRKEGGISSKRKMNKYTKLLTVVYTIFSSVKKIYSLQNEGGDISPFVNNTFYISIFSLVCIYLCGVFSLIWISEQINLRGIGNGTSLIILTSVVSNFPVGIIEVLNKGKNYEISNEDMLFIFVSLCFAVFLVALVENSFYQIKIFSPGKKVFSDLPIQLNPSGIMPPIAAGNLIMIMHNAEYALSNWLPKISGLSDGIIYYMEKILSNNFYWLCLYAFFCILVTFMYTFAIFEPKEKSEELEKNNTILYGYRPGKETQDFINFFLYRIGIFASIYITIINILPLIVKKYYMNTFFEGNQIIICITVSLEILKEIASYLIDKKYRMWRK